MGSRVEEYPVETASGIVMMPVVYENVPSNTTTFEEEKSYLEGLPPEEFRLINISKEKIETPYDERGVVDPNMLIERVRETISPEYRWPGATNLHHGQWPRADYVSMQYALPESRAYSFRELAPNKMQIPKIFHNWIHAVTREPQMPAPEIMQECVREWVLIKNFFDSVQDTIQTVRIFERERSRRTFNIEQEDILNLELARKVEGVLMHFGALEQIPIERWPFSSDVKLQIAAGKVGHLVLKGRLIKTKEVRKTEVGRVAAAA